MNGSQPFPELVLRPVEVGDADAIVATFRGLSDTSLYRRFFTLMPDPSPLVLKHLALVDHHDHEALVVLDLLQSPSGRGYSLSAGLGLNYDSNVILAPAVGGGDARQPRRGDQGFLRKVA